MNTQTKLLNELSDLYKIIAHEENQEIVNFISENIPLNIREAILYFPEKGVQDQNVDFSKVRFIIDLKKLNYLKDINQYFQSVNKLLPDAGMFIGCFESYMNRKRKLYSSFGKLFLWPSPIYLQ